MNLDKASALNPLLFKANIVNNLGSSHPNNFPCLINALVLEVLLISLKINFPV